MISVEVKGMLPVIGRYGGGLAAIAIATTAAAQTSLYLAYPPRNHQTTSDRIFLIGTAPTSGEVFLNGRAIARSAAGHFAPSVPLEMGENRFTLRYGSQEIAVRVVRVSPTPVLLPGEIFAADSLRPDRALARLPGESVCFGAIAAPGAQVSVELATGTVPLRPQPGRSQLPSNSAVLTGENRPLASGGQEYAGCVRGQSPGSWGTPTFVARSLGETVRQTGPGPIAILAPERLEVVEVSVEAGVARTGPSTSYSRLTPLPQGTRDTVTGTEGEWLRLAYGGWIRRRETRSLPDAIPPQATIRSLSSRTGRDATEIVFPLTMPVPVQVRHTGDRFVLTLHHAIAQTDTIFVPPDAIVRAFNWQQIEPTTLAYEVVLPEEQLWGYDLRYEGTSLVLSLRHPPAIAAGSLPLAGVSVLLDPGHGGEELGARGPTGYPEKDVNLVVSELLRAELERRGATVYVTRETDVAVSLAERAAAIARLRPTLALSIHYNALPDNGDAENTAGIGNFWYHPQARDLAQFLHDYLVENLDRPSYGVFWNNLALTRPHAAPSVLLELGFMINPREFEWITDSRSQRQLATTLADAVVAWLEQQPARN